MQLIKRFGELLLGLVWTIIALQHFIHADILSELVPTYMPAKAFLVYLTGVGMLAAGVSLIIKRYIRLAAALLTVILCLFILQLHVPMLAEKLSSTFRWTRALQDIGMIAIALILTGKPTAERVGLYLYAIPMFFFGIGHFMNLDFVTVHVPESIISKTVSNFFFGFVMATAGLSILLKKYVSIAVSIAGASMLVCLMIQSPLLLNDMQDPISWIIFMIQLGLTAGAFIISGISYVPSTEKIPST